MKKVLFFFPHNPYPPKTGAHKRCLELLTGLVAIGGKVCFASSTFTSDQPWTDESVRSVSEMTGNNVYLHTAGFFDKKRSVVINRVKNYFKAQNAIDAWASNSMKSWFSDVVATVNPDVIFMNYAYFDDIVAGDVRCGRKTVMEMHDLVTLNRSMQGAIQSRAGIKNISRGTVPDEVLDLAFFDVASGQADASELSIYNKYDYTLCISESERELLVQHSPATNAIFLPMTHAVADHTNTYDADALFSLGPNLFNVQGYYLFVDKVMPLIRRRQPDFRLQVTGNFYGHIVPRTVEGVEYRGFVSNLQELYTRARCFVCPVFGGTGQQVKIVEAMAHGLPVVAFARAARMSPLRHGVNGLVANSIDEFAELMLRLWNDRELCRSLGSAARATIARDFSRERLLAGLEPLLQDRPA